MFFTTVSQKTSTKPNRSPLGIPLENDLTGILVKIHPIVYAINEVDTILAMYEIGPVLAFSCSAVKPCISIQVSEKAKYRNAGRIWPNTTQTRTPKIDNLFPHKNDFYLIFKALSRFKPNTIAK